MDLRRLLRPQAILGGRDGHLNASKPDPGGNALILAGPAADYDAFTDLQISYSYASDKTRRDEYREDVLDGDLEPVAYTLATWEWMYRNALHLDPPKLRGRWSRFGRHNLRGIRPETSRAFHFLDQNLHRFPLLANPAFDNFCSDLKQRRRRLEDEVSAGERDVTGAVVCPKCKVNYIASYDPKTPCDCEPIPTGRGKETVPRHRQHGGRRDYFECPRCHSTISVGDYKHQVAVDYLTNAAYLRVELMEERTGIHPTNVKRWAKKGLVKRQGKDMYGRQLYDVADTQRHAHSEGICDCRLARPHTDHRRGICCIQCHLEEVNRCPHHTPTTEVVAS